MDHDMRRAAYQMMLIGACALAPAVLGAGPVQAVDTALQLCGGGSRDLVRPRKSRKCSGELI